MEYLHTMVRISDVDASLRFYVEGLGLRILRRIDNEAGRFSLIFLASSKDVDRNAPHENNALLSGLPMIELTWNWDEKGYEGGRNFGHLAFLTDDIYARCQHLQDMGVVINRPPRDGHMAFVRSPDGISVELIQKGEALAPAAPWQSMENQGEW
jgi:lactoylglutathione lyase